MKIAPVIAATMLLLVPLQALADGAYDLHSIIYGTEFYDPNDCTGNIGSGSTSTTTSTAKTFAVTTSNASYNDTSRGGRKVGVTVYTPTDSAPHPLIMFAPGRDRDSSPGGLYGSFLKAVAAQGFVVAGANFPDNTSFGAIPTDAKDISFLIGSVESDTNVQGHINTANGVGLIGHSDGAMIALIEGYANGAKDSRLSAVMAADGALYSGFNFGSGPPLFLMHGTADTTQNISGSNQAFSTISGTYQGFAQVVGADHYHYIAQDTAGYEKYKPVVNTLTGAFFSRVLAGVNGDATNLKNIVASQFNDLVNFKEHGDEADVVGQTNTTTTAGGSTTSQSCCQTTGDISGSFGPGDLPSYIKDPYNRIFTAAAKKHNMDPALLVAIFYDENYGITGSVAAFKQHLYRNPPAPYGSGPLWPGQGSNPGSSAGAQGPFQFIPSTWAGYAEVANGHPPPDVNDLTDAAFGAAHLLAASGATMPETDQKVFNAAHNYNHDNAYATAAQTIFDLIKKDESAGVATGGTGATTSTTASTSNDCGGGGGAQASTQGLYNPFHDMTNVLTSRIDSGADFGGRPGTKTPLYPIGDNAIIDIATNNSTFYTGSWISYHVKTAQGKTLYVYYSEGCPLAGNFSPGQKVDHNTPLCNLIQSSTGIEIGWQYGDAPNGTPNAQAAAAYGVYIEGHATVWGQNFYEFLQSVGLTVKDCYDYPGTPLFYNPGHPNSSLPAGWPTWVANPATKEGPNHC